LRKRSGPQCARITSRARELREHLYNVLAAAHAGRSVRQRETDRDRFRKCDAPDCDVYFLDTSKGQPRQWCSMSNCGNREKQRRWRSAKR
jgi:predicted RNA-binding Zn ribbon-like protein